MATSEHRHTLRERLHVPHLRHDYRCTSCGYGAVALKAPPRCPMCGGIAWSRGR
jgi:rubrerythrin